MFNVGMGFYSGDNMNKDIQQEGQKIIIAHQGASGYLPSHTLEAYTLAYGLGADYIEPDLNMTKDGVLVCTHDTYLESITDVEVKYPDKIASDGRCYVKDFNLEEIKKLNVHTYRYKDGSVQYPNRFNPEYKFLKIPTFEEVIMLVQGLNRSTGKNIGIYPELKHASWYNESGFNIEKATLNILNKYGYSNGSDKVFIQCFEQDSLKKLKFEFDTKLSLIQLIGSEDDKEKMLTIAGLNKIATYAVGIGPEKNWINKDPGIVIRAHNIGLKVHPWTFARESIADKYNSLEEELSTFYYTYNVDGLFVEQPDTAYWVLNAWRLK